MLVEHTTVTGNQARARRRRLGRRSRTGATATVADGALTIRNSTISGNTRAQRRRRLQLGRRPRTPSSIEDSTIADNSASATAGGGIRVTEGDGRTVTRTRSSRATPATATPSNCSAQNGGTITSNGQQPRERHRLRLHPTGDLQDTDPQLGPLQDNGGPTDTMAIPPASPAVDARRRVPAAGDRPARHRRGRRAARATSARSSSWSPPPANDDCANAIDLGSGASGSTTGTNIGATVEDGEPGVARRSPTQITTGKTVWWKWTAPSTGAFEFDTIGSDIDTMLGVFTGLGVDALTRGDVRTTTSAATTLHEQRRLPRDRRHHVLHPGRQLRRRAGGASTSTGARAGERRLRERRAARGRPARSTRRPSARRRGRRAAQRRLRAQQRLVRVDGAGGGPVTLRRRREHVRRVGSASTPGAASTRSTPVDGRPRRHRPHRAR